MYDLWRGRIVRFIPPVLKTGKPQGFVGPNPTPSAIAVCKPLGISYKITLMNDDTTPGNTSDDPNLFKPDSVMTSDKITSEKQAPSKLPQPLTANVPMANLSDNHTRAIHPTDLSTSPNGVNWTASEFIGHYKSVGWYTLLGLVAIIIAALVWFMTKDKISTALVFIGILLLGIYGAHKPREMTYTVDDQGLTIGRMHHMFSEFRSFSVVPEGAFSENRVSAA